MILGRHVLVDGTDVPAATLNDCAKLEGILQAACVFAGATILKTTSHQFEPQGVTAFCLLAESHASIHTYPEYGRYMADIFTCGDLDPQVAADVLCKALGGKYTTQRINRPIEGQ